MGVIPFVVFAKGWKDGKPFGAGGTTVERAGVTEFTESALNDAFPLALVADKDDAHLISFASYKPGATRGRNGIESLHTVVLDFDQVPPGTLDRITRHVREQGALCWAYTTWSHANPAAPRKPWAAAGGQWESFRLVFPLGRGVSLAAWKTVYKAFEQDMVPAWARGPGFDDVSETGAQGWYAPACPPELEGSSVSDVLAGSPFCVDVAPHETTTGAELARVSGAHAVTREDLEMFYRQKSRSTKDGADVHARVARALLDGVAWGKTNRHTDLVEFMGALGFWVAMNHNQARIDPGPTSLLFEASCAAVTRDGVRDVTDCAKMARLLDELTAHSPEMAADWLAEQANETPLFPATRVLGGEDHFKFTDLGNAERLAHRHGEYFRYVTPWGLWYVWDGRRWVKDEKEIRLLAAAKETIRNIYKSADQVPDPELCDKLKKFAHASESRSALGNMVSLVRSARPPTAHTELDQNPWLLNVANGTVDLKSGVLLPHTPSDLISKISPVVFDEKASCPTWERFVLEVCDGHVELASYLQRAIGYSLTGDVSEHALFLLHGDGCNGKSVLVGTLLALLGEYGGKAPMDLLVKTQNAKHETGIAKLHGLRLAAVTETEEGSSWAESVVKDITGGDTITARRMREDFWDFKPSHKLWVCANHEPEVKGSDQGIWRRLKKVPFNASFLGKEDKGLSAKLSGELSGILAWAVRGCLAWQRDGLGESKDVSEATEAYRSENDAVGKFLAECCHFDVSARVARQDLMRAFEHWCAAQGEPAPKAKVFAKRLRALGVTDKKVHTPQGSRDGWAGMCLTSDLASLELN